MEVGDRQGELTIAPKLLTALDLQGKIVTSHVYQSIKAEQIDLAAQ